MRLTIEAASSLARLALGALGYDAGEASLIADRLLDGELREIKAGRRRDDPRSLQACMPMPFIRLLTSGQQ